MKRTAAVISLVLGAFLVIPGAAHASSKDDKKDDKVEKSKDKKDDKKKGDDGGVIPDGIPCTSGQIYFQFLYTDGRMDIGCADQNDVTPAENPGQIAPMLHVSCSDSFAADGTATKSDLGGQLVAEYLIIKGVGSSKAKTCGTATPVPAGGSGGMLLFAGLGTGALAIGAQVARRRRTKTQPTPA